MTIITAVKTGNWSDPTVWDSNPVMPAAGDTVRTGNYAVTIDQNITVDTIEATGTGYFLVGAAGITINANVATSHTGGFQGGLRIANTTGTTTLNGNIVGGSTANAHGVAKSAAGAFVINGNITGGGAGNNALQITGGAVTINGNVTGGSAANATGIFHNSNTVCTVNGITTGGSGSSSYGCRNFATSGTLAVIETAGGSGFGAVGLISDNATNTTIFKIARFGTNGGAPIGGFAKMLVDPTVNYVRVKRSDTGADYDLSNDYPAIADVKAGTVYKLGTLTGTLNNSVIVIED
jgi:hypothetical protein